MPKPLDEIRGREYHRCMDQVSGDGGRLDELLVSLVHEPFSEEQRMKGARCDIFNRVYRGDGMYYGWELCKEFTDFLDGMDLEGKAALDAGCGEGRYAIYLAERGCHVTAIDISEVGLDKLVRIAEDRGLDINCILGDLRDYTFPEGTYDIVVAATVLGHLEDGTRKRVVAGIKRTLAPGGIVYLNVFTVDDPGYRVQRGGRSGEGHMESGVSDTSMCVEYYYRPNELRREFKDLEILYYSEGMQRDSSHGTPHYHGLARMIAKKPGG
ncbi:MAG: class I SAM-dependent methyltransferase [Anaerolineae bacterium]